MLGNGEVLRLFQGVVGSAQGKDNGKEETQWTPDILRSFRRQFGDQLIWKCLQ